MINPWPYAPACDAPGWPGIEPRWTSSAKSGVGTALTAMSRTWFTLSHGILNEIDHRASTFVCTGGLRRHRGRQQIPGRAEEARPASDRRFARARAGIWLTTWSTPMLGHYRITKRIVSDPYRDVILQRLTFEALSQTGGRYRVVRASAPPIWSTPVPATRRGWVNIRACRCCLLKGGARHWLWPARCLGATPVQASSATRTAGRCFHPQWQARPRSGLWAAKR